MSDQPTDAFGNVNNNDVITGCVQEDLHAIRSGLSVIVKSGIIEMPNLSSNDEVHDYVF